MIPTNHEGQQWRPLLSRVVPACEAGAPRYGRSCAATLGRQSPFFMRTRRRDESRSSSSFRLRNDATVTHSAVGAASAAPPPRRASYLRRGRLLHLEHSQSAEHVLERHAFLTLSGTAQCSSSRSQQTFQPEKSGRRRWRTPREKRRASTDTRETDSRKLPRVDRQVHGACGAVPSNGTDPRERNVRRDMRMRREQRSGMNRRINKNAGSFS